MCHKFAYRLFAVASTPSTMFESTTNSDLEIARTHVRHGALAEAEQFYRRVANKQPEQVEALRFLANAALSRGEVSEAVTLLSHAVQVDRSNTWVLLELGVAYRSAQRMDEARSVFEAALESSHGTNTTARLLLANVYELDGRPEMALLQYFRAIIDAQTHGLWQNDSTTEPGLRQLVKHAMQYVDAGRHKLFDDALQPFRHGINVARLGRVDTALAVYLNERLATPADPHQRPTFLYVPDLGVTRFLDTSAFDWLCDWAARVVATCRVGTLDRCIGSTAQEDTTPALFSLTALTTTRIADASGEHQRSVPLYQRGIPQESIQSWPLGLRNLVDEAPLVRIPNYAPDVVVLDMPSGTTTSIRVGRTNAFCMIVVAFEGSAPLRVSVGGEAKQLHAGNALAFDPSFGFNYAASDGPARALVVEVWNPGISSLERDALTALTTSVVDFDSRLQDLA
ncbi:MAG: tetratricopeptide repeat protein [Rhodanobacteraceae bacterium]|nr:MAG: tetratricopeptide repeat protein [Rhodanobacteraceae bacterium]